MEIHAKSNLQNPVQQICLGIYPALIHAGNRSRVTTGRAFARYYPEDLEIPRNRENVLKGRFIGRSG
jgi:hypothetical protein